MPSPFYYRRAILQLARFAGDDYPPEIAVQAAIVLADELSPHNPRRELVRQLLEYAHPYEYARHTLRELYDHSPQPDAPDLLDLLVLPEDTLTLLEEEEAIAEDDDPL